MEPWLWPLCRAALQTLPNPSHSSHHASCRGILAKCSSPALLIIQCNRTTLIPASQRAAKAQGTAKHFYLGSAAGSQMPTQSGRDVLHPGSICWQQYTPTYISLWIISEVSLAFDCFPGLFLFICLSQEFFISKSLPVYFQGHTCAKLSPWLFLSLHLHSEPSVFCSEPSVSSFMSATSCLEKGQMYWLVMAAASLASLSEWLWERKNQA